MNTSGFEEANYNGILFFKFDILMKSSTYMRL